MTPSTPASAAVVSIQPRAEIRDRVLSIDVIEREGGEQLVLPSTAAVLGFQTEGRVRSGRELLAIAGVTGVQDSARSYGYVGATRSVLVRFTPQGACCLGVPASELARRSVALEAVVSGARELIERLQNTADLAVVLDLLTDFLARRPFAPDPLVDRALRGMRLGPEKDCSVTQLAKNLHVSERHLERRFRERVGSSPKRWLSLARFERAAALIGRGCSLTQVARAAGYYDQSHFIRDFRRYAGTTPGALGPAR